MSAGPNYVLDKGFVANEAITQYELVKLTSTEGAVDMADTANEQILGVAQEAATSDEATDGKVINVRMMGVSTVIAGEAISIGSLVNAKADGRVKDLAAATKQKVCGIALTAAAADGDHIDVWLMHAEVDNS